MPTFDLTFRNTTHDQGCTKALVRRIFAAAMPFLGLSRGHSIELAIMVIGSARMRALNKKWRKIDRPTDVLSFPLHMRPIKGYTAVSLGDIFVCPMVVRRKAKEESRPVREQMRWTILHGILHLAGYDHPDAERSGPRLKHRGEQMFRLEQKILQRLTSNV